MPRLSTHVPAIEPCIEEALRRLDRMAQNVTEWEAEFLDNIMRGPQPWSPKQRAVLARMCSQYLKDDALGEEILGQQRLF